MTEEKTNMPVNMSTGELISTEGEMSTGTAAAQFAEIQGTIMIAKHFPRNVDKALEAVTKACSRLQLAKIAEYSFPRGGKQIAGKSVYLARELARCFGNIRYGLEVVYEDENRIQIRGWCWDIENNVKVSADDKFQKLIQRKDKRTDITKWITPDERDLRELVFRRGAILVRNCILQVVPSDLSDDAIAVCKKTLAGSITDMAAEKKKIIFQFGKLNVSVDMLEKYIDIKSTDWNKETLVELTGVYNAIRDNQSSVGAYFGKVQSKPKADDDKTENTMADDIDKTMNGAKAGKSEDHKEVYDKDKDKPEPEMKKTASDTEPNDKSLYPMSEKTRQTLTEKMNGRKFRNTKPNKNLKTHILSVLKRENSTEGEADFCLRSLEQLPIREDD